MTCVAVASQQVFDSKSKKKRFCVVCRFENRKATVKTDFCSQHSVCLCKKIYEQSNDQFGCDRPDLTCWQKYHQVYLPIGLFSRRGNINKSSSYYQKKKTAMEATAGVLQSPDSSRARTLSFESLHSADFTSDVVHRSSFEF